jgi:hypothetical protein
MVSTVRTSRLPIYVQPQGGKSPFQVAFAGLEVRAS